MSTPHIGSSFKEFLVGEEINDEVTAAAAKRVLARQLDQARRAQGLSKREMARPMHTSRSQLDRLLDPATTQTQLDTLQRTASMLGRRLNVELM